MISSCCTQVPGSFTFSSRWKEDRPQCTVDKGHLGTNRCQSFIHFLQEVKGGECPPVVHSLATSHPNSTELVEAGWFPSLSFLPFSFFLVSNSLLANGRISLPSPSRRLKLISLAHREAPFSSPLPSPHTANLIHVVRRQTMPSDPGLCPGSAFRCFFRQLKIRERVYR